MELFIKNQTDLKGKFFNPQNGVVHFFIRPLDDYITQSLQMYDEDEYLYALLKNEGYQNIVFCYFNESGVPKGYSYDEKSVKVFYSYKKDNEKPDLTGKNYIGKVEYKDRQYRECGFPEDDVDVFFSRIRKALRDDRVKTAIIMPLSEIQLKLKLNKIERSQGASILVFTETNTDSFIDVCDGDVLKTLQKHSEFRSVRSGSKVFEKLKGKSNLLIIGEVDTDEIAGLLYNEKLMNRKLEGVPYYAINAIANMIKLQFSGDGENFNNLPDKLSVKSLRLWLSNVNTQKEIADKAKTIETVEPIYCNNGMYVRRIHSDFVCSVRHKKNTDLVIDENGAYLSKENLKQLSDLEKLSSVKREILNDRLIRSVPYVVGDNNESIGTAFIITPDGFALTCTHVVGDNAEMRISFSEEAFPTKKEFLCKVVNKLSIDGHDVTLLKIQSDEEFSYIPLSKDEKLGRSDEFITAGYSGGLDRLSCVEVKISVTGIKNKDEKVFGLDKMLHSGCSGSPFVSIKDGCVKGIFFGDIVIKNGSVSCGKPVKYLWDWFTR